MSSWFITNRLDIGCRYKWESVVGTLWHDYIIVPVDMEWNSIELNLSVLFIVRSAGC
jgi:hypothetical protein